MLKKVFRPRMAEERGCVGKFILKSFRICVFKKIFRMVKSLIMLLARYAERIE